MIFYKAFKIFCLGLILINCFFSLSAQAQTTHVGKTYVGAVSEIKKFLCTPTDASTNSTAASSDLYNCINKVYRFALVIAGVFGVFFIVLAGWMWLSAEGNEESVTKAKEILASSVIAFVVLSGGYVLLNFLNPDLVKFQPIQPESVVGKERAYRFDKVSDSELNAFIGLDSKNPGSQSFPPAETKAGSCKSTTGTVNGFYQFSQCSGSWVNTPYSSKNQVCKESDGSTSTINTSACGPSAMASVLKFYESKRQLKPTTQVNGLQINPETIAKLTTDLNERTCGKGTNSTMFPKVANLFGAKAEPISGWDNIAKEINLGHPVIAAMGPGKFTVGGHFIVLHKIQGSKVFIADSGPRGITESDITTVQKEMTFAIIIKPN